ncbi:MAG: hypothetical protein ACI9BW_000422 [Gammaproteobacteria bacterium]|jgi:hypothetical protein
MSMEDQQISPKVFAGAWRLVDSYAETENGRCPFPLGEGTLGFVMYDDRGHMSAQLMSASREAFSSRNPVVVELQEFKTAYQGYTSYYGTYTLDIDNRTITHHVEGSLAQSWVGGVQVRHFEFIDGQLILKTPPIRGSDGTKVVSTLTWQRA